jgi:hypothetical protein
VTSEHDAVETALRRWLARDGESSRAVGRVGEFDALRRAAPSEEADDVEHDLRLGTVRVVDVSGDHAVAEIEARVVTDYLHRGRARQRFVRNYDGPVILTRVDGQWRVTDYCDSGRMRSSSIFTPDATAETPGVKIRVRAVELAARGTVVVLEVENMGDSDLRLRRCFVGRPWIGKRRRYQPLALVSERAIAPGKTSLVDASLTERGLPLDTKQIAVAVALQREGEAVERRFVIDVPLTGPAMSNGSAVVAEWPTEMRPSTHRRLAGVLLPLLAITVYCAARGDWSLVGAWLVANGAAFLIPFRGIGRLERRMRVRLALAGVSLLVLGAVCLVLGGDPSFRP